MKKSLKNNFGFLKNSHNPLEIGSVPRPCQKKIRKQMFQIVRLPILGKVMAFWGLFNAPFDLNKDQCVAMAAKDF